jgi:hypothetical protein
MLPKTHNLREHSQEPYIQLNWSLCRAEAAMTSFAGKLTDLRLRMSNVKAKIHKTLMDMFQAVSQGSMEPSELEEKLSSLEGLTGSTSAKTASSGERTVCCGRKHSCSAHILKALHLQRPLDLRFCKPVVPTSCQSCCPSLRCLAPWRVSIYWTVSTVPCPSLGSGRSLLHCPSSPTEKCLDARY